MTATPQPLSLLSHSRHSLRPRWPVLYCILAATNFLALLASLYLHPKREISVLLMLLVASATAYGFRMLQQLLRSIGEKVHHTETLRQAYDKLEQHILERTAELAQINETLRAEIAERERAEAAVRESEARLFQFLEALPVGVFVIEAVGTLVYSNSVAHQILGQQEPEDLAPTEFPKHYRVYLAKTDQVYPPERQPILRALAGETVTVDDMEIRHADRIIPLHVTAAPIYDGAGHIRYAIAAFSDITEIKKVDQMKNEFVSTVSHELRTPLTSIRGSLDLIAGGIVGELPPQVKALIDIACKNSERLIHLINDILDIEKIESGKLVFHNEVLDLQALVEQTLESNRAYGEQFGVRFALDHGVAGAQVYADSQRLTQVLTNLLSNAAKFSPSHETVHVAVTRHEQMMRVAVTDQGPGIPEEFRPRVFTKFAQADSSDTRQKGGTGLGLNICKAIVERLGGRIGFASQPHVATTFYIDVPEWQPAEVASSASSRQSERPRILICEDDRDVATLLSLILTQGGFATDIVPDAAQAKCFLAQHSYTAMTLDLRLPGQDGLSLIKELRQQECTQHLPIVVVSAVAQQGRAELNGEAFRIVDWINKPIDQTRLLTAVQQAASGKAPRKPFILHVEDDIDVHQVVATVLSDVADIVRAGTLHEARRRLAQEHFDLLLLDVGLPDGCGLELLSSLRALTTRAIPVVIFSATDTTTDPIQHVAATLVKTRSSSQELLETIRTLITPSNVTAI